MNNFFYYKYLFSAFMKNIFIIHYKSFFLKSKNISKNIINIYFQRLLKITLLLIKN